MKCIVIDDEPFALDLIKDYIRKTPFLELSASFSNPLKALSFLSSANVDLIFLDINMPEITGIQLLKSLNYQPMVIFTTAYSEYGVESYDYNAIDYLLKPVKYERFLKAVNKAADIILKKEGFKNNSNSEKLIENFIFIKSGNRQVKVSPSDLLYIEGAGNYMTFHTKDTKILSLLNMQDVINILPAEEFVRVHKSFIISINNIEAIDKHNIIINGKYIPIGITYREQVNSIINKISK